MEKDFDYISDEKEMKIIEIRTSNIRFSIE